MKVGISTTSIEKHLTGGKRDGIGVYTENLISSLSKLDELDYEGFYYPRSLFDKYPQHQEFQSKQFHAPFYMSSILSNLLGIYDINNKMIESRVDVYHATDYKIPKLKQTPVVATLYDAIPLKHPEWVSARLRWLKNYILLNSAGWIDHAITISNYMAADIVEYWGVPEEKISVVYCGVSEYWSQMQTIEKIEIVKRKHGITRPYVLFVGTFQPRKNINRIIDSYKALPEYVKNDFQLVLVGREGWRTQSLMQAISKLEQEGMCIWIKDADDADLRCLYQGSSVFLFPSLAEGFGMPVLEAFASKAPVITSKGSALEEIAGGAAILVDPYSVEDISRAMTEVVSKDEGDTQTMINKGLERCRLFSWESAARQIYDIYKKVV